MNIGGQIYQEENEFDPSRDSLIYDYLIPMREQHLTIESLLNLYDQYAKECYVDSTQHEELKPCYSLVYPPCPGHPYNPPKYYYTHKETSFEGFIAWLRKQLERE